jgi:hypothetical protein
MWAVYKYQRNAGQSNVQRSKGVNGSMNFVHFQQQYLRCYNQRDITRPVNICCQMFTRFTVNCAKKESFIYVGYID